MSLVSLRVCCLGCAAVGCCCIGVSYVVEIAITEESCTTSNHRPEAFPSSFLGSCDTRTAFDISLGCIVVAISLLLSGGSHDDVCES